MILSRILVSSILLFPTGVENHNLPQAERLLNEIVLQDHNLYVKGSCESLKQVFYHYGMTADEEAFFFGRGILERESGCGRDTYNDRTGDTGVCQLTHLHSKPGYFFGEYYERGWAVELFGLYVGKRFSGLHKDHPNIVPACLWLLRGGSFEPGTINRDPWKASW